MRIGEVTGNTPSSIQQNNSPTFAKLSEFGSSSLESKGGSEKGAGIVSKTFNAILSIPTMILLGTYTLVKYTIYFASWGICCKPEHSPKALKAALQKVIDAEDKQAAWKQFAKNYPRGVDQLIKMAIAVIRDAQIGPKCNDPQKVAEWNKNNLEQERKDLRERFNNQDMDLLNQAAGFLQQLIDAKAKK